MPGPFYANVAKLAQFTPGELSPDQAIRNFYYKIMVALRNRNIYTFINFIY